jgi:hypothetical protein
MVAEAQKAAEEFFFTLGVMYGYGEDDAQHPLGVHHDEYVVVEAPDELTARRIFIAACGGENLWSMTFTRDEFFMRGAEHVDAKYPEGEALRIAWFTKEGLELFHETLTRATYGSRD